LRDVFPNKIVSFAENQTFWPPQIFGLATPLDMFMSLRT